MQIRQIMRKDLIAVSPSSKVFEAALKRDQFFSLEEAFAKA